MWLVYEELHKSCPHASRAETCRFARVTRAFILSQLNDKSQEAEQRTLDALERAIAILESPSGAEVSQTVLVCRSLR
jgi:hypothetical protein